MINLSYAFWSRSLAICPKSVSCSLSFVATVAKSVSLRVTCNCRLSNSVLKSIANWLKFLRKSSIVDVVFKPPLGKANVSAAAIDEP